MLNIYENVGDTDPYSVDGLFTNPLIFPFDGRVGGSLEKRLYIRNSSALYDYEDITLTPEVIDGSIDYIGETGASGYFVKLNEGDERPSVDNWSIINGGNEITFTNDISDVATYLPFWVRIEVPAQISTQQIKNVRLTISATQALHE